MNKVNWDQSKNIQTTNRDWRRKRRLCKRKRRKPCAALLVAANLVVEVRLDGSGEGQNVLGWSYWTSGRYLLFSYKQLGHHIRFVMTYSKLHKSFKTTLHKYILHIFCIAGYLQYFTSITIKMKADRFNSNRHVVYRMTRNHLPPRLSRNRIEFEFLWDKHRFMEDGGHGKQLWRRKSFSYTYAERNSAVEFSPPICVWSTAKRVETPNS